MKRFPAAEILVAGFVIVAGAGVYLYSHRHEDAIAATREQGDMIVAALDRARGQSGVYPRSLADLVPTNLDSLPSPAWGDRWEYATFDDGAQAELYVTESGGGDLTLRYDFTGRGWALDN